MCKTVVIFRAMNGFSPGAHRRHRRARRRRRSSGDMLHSRAYGWQSAGQMFSPTFMRHMYDYGTTPEQVAAVQGDPLASTPPTIPRPTTRSASRWRTCWRAASSASRCTCSTAASRPTTPRPSSSPAPSAPRDCRHPRALIRGVVGPLLQAAHRHALPARADLDGRRPLRARDPVAQRRRRARGHRRHRLLRRLHLHHHAAARGLRLLQEGRGRRTTSATAPSGSAASGPTTPAAAICARATRTA